MDDRISTLPDELLHLVLHRLGCGRAAARTSILSRRWSGVCSGLPKPDLDVTLHDLPLDTLEAALLRLAAGPGVRLLDVRVSRNKPQVGGSTSRFVPDGPQPHHHRYIPRPRVVVPGAGRPPPRFADAGAGVSAVLRAAAALAPVEVRFAVTETSRPLLVVGLPSFLRATSMELRGLDLRLAVPRELPLLERLTLSGCNDVDLAALIPWCPRLRALTLDNFTIESATASLQELLEQPLREVAGGVDASTLRQWARLSFLNGGQVHLHLHRWSLSYPKVTHGLGLWGLVELSLKTAKTQGDDLLSLHMTAQDSTYSFQNAEHSFDAEIVKHVLAHFSTLNLHLTTKGHAFGAFVLRLLAMHRLRDIENIKIILLSTSEAKEACQLNCPCDEPKGWRSQISPCLSLQKVKIEGFKGRHHELDFLKVLLRCSPMLKSVTVTLPDQDMPSGRWWTRIHNIFEEYPLVEGNIDLVYD